MAMNADDLITPDDLVRGAMTLRDEATMLGLCLKNPAGSHGLVLPNSIFSAEHHATRRESLERCAAYLDLRATELQAEAA